jgi:Flp pilus assembly protein protease CpaA
MHLIAAWPTLTVLALAALLGICISDSRTRFIVNWLVLPVLCEGVLLHWFYFNAP